jgi:hypothetical protein
MSVVMREEPLSTEGEQSVYPAQPLIEPVEVMLVTLPVDRIGLAQASRCYMQDPSAHR